MYERYGKPLVKGDNRVEEYMRDKGREDSDQARRDCWNRENWWIFCRGQPLGKFPGENEASEL